MEIRKLGNWEIGWRWMLRIPNQRISTNFTKPSAARRSKFLLISLISIFLFSPAAFALSCDDNADGNWGAAGTWTNCGGGTPGAGDDVTIDSNVVTLAANANTRDVTIAGGTLDLSSYTLNVARHWARTSGTFTASTGTVLFTGTGAQTLTSGGQGFNNLIVNDGLVGYWKLDETAAGTFTDSSGYGNTGTGAGAGGANNTPQPSATVPTVNFTDGRSLNFDGTDDYVSTSNINAGTVFTISVWIKPTAVNTTYGIVGERSATARTWAFYVRATGELGFTLDSVNDYNSSSAGLTAGDWQHVAAVINGVDLTIYRNGTSVYSTTMGNTAQYDGTPFQIGADGGGSFFSGLIDDVRIYTRALSSTEIGRLAAGNQPLTTASGSSLTLQDALTVNGNCLLNSGNLDTKSGSNYAITVAGNWDNNGGILTGRTSTITLTGDNDNSQDTFTVLSGGAQMPRLVFDAAEDGGSGLWDHWLLSDDLTTSRLTVTDGTFNDNGKTITLNDTTSANFTIANTTGILTSSGTWVMAASGTIENADSAANANRVNTLKINSGVTATIVSAVGYFQARSIIMLGTSTLTGAYTVVLWAATSDFLDISSTATISSYILVIPLASPLTQKAFSTAAALELGYAGSTTIQMTGDWTIDGSLRVQGGGGANAEGLAMVLDTDGHNLTVGGVLILGISDLCCTDGYQGKVLLGSGSHTVGGNFYVHQGPGGSKGYFTFGSSKVSIAGNFVGNDATIDMGSSTVSVGGNVDLTSADAFTKGTSTLILKGTGAQTLTTAAQSFNNLAINDGLVGYWKLDETAGATAYDSSGYANDGTNSGATISATVPTVNFVNLKSLDMGGTDYVTVPNSNALELSGAVTMAAWIKSSGTNDYSGIVEKSNGSTQGYQMGLSTSASKIIRCDLYDGSSYNTLTSPTEVLDGSWHFVACTYDGTTASLYVDGTVSTAGPWSSFVVPSGQALILGHDDCCGAARSWNGNIDDVRIYNRALSSTEIARLAAGNQPQTGLGTYTLQDALDVDGNLLLNAGTLDTKSGSNYAITVGGNWDTNGGLFTPRTGTVTLDATSGTKTILSGSQSFNALTLNDGGGSTTVQLNDALDVNGALSITGGTLDTKSGGNYAIAAAGNWTNADTFTARSGTVTFDGSAGQIVTTGGSNFNDVTVTNASGAGVTFADGWTAANLTDTTAGSKLKFQNATTYTLTGTLTLRGTSGNNITLDTDDGAAAAFTLDVTGGRQEALYVTVANANASTNDIIGRYATDNGGTDSAAASPHWILDPGNKPAQFTSFYQ